MTPLASLAAVIVPSAMLAAVTLLAVGGSAVGMTPLASLAAVTALSWMFAVATAFDPILPAPTADAPIFADVTAPSAMLLVPMPPAADRAAS